MTWLMSNAWYGIGVSLPRPPLEEDDGPGLPLEDPVGLLGGPPLEAVFALGAPGSAGAGGGAPPLSSLDVDDLHAAKTKVDMPPNDTRRSKERSAAMMPLSRCIAHAL
jgi:hypothetical protein